MNRICHSITGHFALKIILSWRYLRNSRHRKNFLASSFCLEAGYEFPFMKVFPLSSPIPGWGKNKETNKTLSLEIESQPWVGSAQTNLSNLTLSFPYVFHPSCNLLPLETQTHFPLSCHFTNLLCFVKMVYTYSPWESSVDYVWPLRGAQAPLQRNPSCRHKKQEFNKGTTHIPGTI